MWKGEKLEKKRNENGMEGQNPCNICKLDCNEVDCVLNRIRNKSYYCRVYDCMMNHEGNCLMELEMSKYISIDRVKELFDYAEQEFTIANSTVRCIREAVESLPAADVVAVQSVIDRMNEERKRAKGNWHTDPYWLGWLDAMRRAQRIVDGTVDDEPMYAHSNEDKRETEK